MIHYLKTTFERLVTADTFPKLYHDTVLLAAGFIIAFLFRQPIKELFDRISKHTDPLLGETEFHSKPALSKFQEPAKQKSNEAINTGNAPPKNTIEYYKSAHFYWLGSDLMEAIRSVAVVPNKELTIQALLQSLRHFTKAGLKDDAIEARMKWLIDINTKKLPSEWNTETSRKDILNEILVVRDKISQLVGREAGDQFKPFED